LPPSLPSLPPLQPRTPHDVPSPHMPQSRSRYTRSVAAPTTVAALALLAGCGGMDRIDHRIDTLVLDQSAVLGADAAPADRRFRTGRVDDEDRKAQLNKSPETRNPDAKDLFYVQAEAARLEAASV